MKKPVAPCMKCLERTPECHGKCEKYEAYRILNNEFLKSLREEKRKYEKIHYRTVDGKDWIR